MTVYLDDEPVSLAGDTLGGLLDAARRLLGPSGRIVVEVKVDGQSLAGPALDPRRPLPGADAGAEVRLYSADPGELAVLTLRQVRARMEDARQAQADAASLFQQDHLNDAMQSLARAVEVWQQVQQAVLHSAGLLGLGLDSRAFEGKPLSVATDALLAQIRNLRDMIAGGDTVGLADSLAYEWPETTARWERLIDELVRWIEQRGDRRRGG